MPNWCDNTLEIAGPQGIADALRALMTTAETAFDFAVIVGPPQTVDDDATVEWCCIHWGTKWNAVGPEWVERVDHDCDAAHVVRFSTAWSPPLPLVAALSRRFPTLTLRLSFDESELGFRGFATFADGRLLANKTEDYVPVD